jgi:hypothetical protein
MVVREEFGEVKESLIQSVTELDSFIGDISDPIIKASVMQLRKMNFLVFDYLLTFITALCEMTELDKELIDEELNWLTESISGLRAIREDEDKQLYKLK